MIPTIASLSQVVDGLRIADGLSTSCDSCQAQLDEGQPVRCRIEHRPLFGDWELAALYCGDCGSQEQLAVPGTALVAGRLGTVRDTQTQSSWLVLLDPEPISAYPEWLSPSSK